MEDSVREADGLGGGHFMVPSVRILGQELLVLDLVSIGCIVEEEGFACCGKGKWEFEEDGAERGVF